MKRTLLFVLMATVIFLTSCETTREITLRTDGSGIITTTSDLSGLIGIAKMAGESNELDKLKDEKAIDTTIMMDKMAEQLPDLTEEEKTVIKKGTLGFNMDMKNDKFVISMTLPFTQTNEIALVDKIYSRVIAEAAKKQMDSSNTDLPAGIPKDGLPEGSIDDYYNINFSKGVIERKLLADKYAGVATDEKMKAMKEMSAMGIGNSKLVLYLPSPAKKTEGKNLTLSEDKKTVTIMSTMEDFFADGKSLEFKVEF